jgi:hypothetical protein
MYIHNVQQQGTTASYKEDRHEIMYTLLMIFDVISCDWLENGRQLLEWDLEWIKNPN